MKDIRIAAVSFNSLVNRPDDNLARIEPWVRQAKKQGAQLVCFPELAVTGYSTRPEIKHCAEPVPGPISRRLQQMAREHHVVILAGMAEKDAGGRVYASHLMATPAEIAGVYRKIHIAPPEQGIFAPGDAVPLFKAAGIKLGIQLCYDVHFPELSTRMALDGADVIFMPHASPRGTPQQKLNSWRRHLTARAFDNGVFVVACNQAGKNRQGLEFPGVAVVIGPSGNVLKQKTAAGEAMLTADLKADALADVRGHNMRYFLPHRRPEMYAKRS